ncbi:MAG: D-alanyl-D-alanine carboxypeptidase/D-alanyl-D-alanine-endopeptidase [Citromicrobium sp.]|nr:MAG: D-alanyl-D-alanine carboxypeptidase/D-alanyl-D-alanine-endopeptidase [Citromicrobium sp.]
MILSSLHRVLAPFLAALLTLAPLPATAAPPALEHAVAQAFAQAPHGTRFGLLVVDEDGQEVIAVNPDQRFIPASNTKLLTTAAALAMLADVGAPDRAGGATVALEGQDAVLRGHGDARLSSAPDCVTNCLAALADAVAARSRHLRAVVGDDTRFPDERWSPGMSWNNISTRYGTGISALTLDDNEAVLTITPGAPAAAPTVSSLGYYTVTNLAVTRAGAPTALDIMRMPGERTLRLTGTIAPDAAPATLRIGIDDPAHYAAWRMGQLLAARGVRISAPPEARHRPLSASDDPAHRGAGTVQPLAPAPVLATLTAAPLAEDIRIVNKVSQNLHAELLMRRLGLIEGAGSLADGIAMVARLMAAAGVPRTAWDLADGSGMSSYNRIAPRALVGLLRYGASQPWGAAWRETFPIGGVDGTIARRFRGTALEGKIFAKTGTLNQTNALSGYLIAASGRTLTFSLIANDVPGDVGATGAMDAALVAIAAAN